MSTLDQIETQENSSSSNLLFDEHFMYKTYVENSETPPYNEETITETDKSTIADRRKQIQDRIQGGTLEGQVIYNLKDYVKIAKDYKEQLDTFILTNEIPQFLKTEDAYYDFFSFTTAAKDSINRHLEWYRTTPADELYWIGGIVSHDVSYILANSMRDKAKLGKIAISGKQIEQETLISISDGLGRLILFIEDFESFLLESTTDRTVTISNTAKTFEVAPKTVIEFEDDEFVIESLTEYISVMTLIRNALQQDAKLVRVTARRSKVGATFRIFDNVGEGQWPIEYIEEFNKSYEQGRENPTWPGNSNSGGGKIVAEILGKIATRLNIANRLYRFGVVGIGSDQKYIEITIPNIPRLENKTIEVKPK